MTWALEPVLATNVGHPGLFYRANNLWLYVGGGGGILHGDTQVSNVGLDTWTPYFHGFGRGVLVQTVHVSWPGLAVVTYRR